MIKRRKLSYRQKINLQISTGKHKPILPKIRYFKIYDILHYITVHNVNNNNIWVIIFLKEHVSGSSKNYSHCFIFNVSTIFFGFMFVIITT